MTLLKEIGMKSGFERPIRLAAGGFALAIVLVVPLWAAGSVEYLSGRIWPEPRLVTPGSNGLPPSDAIVLFDGKSMSAWDGGDRWIIEDGVAIASGTGIQSKQPFGDCQLHLEWASPSEVEGRGQGRGNSGIYLMGRYEIQILDSYQNKTYPDGSAGAVYKQSPPMVNVCLPPGEWQVYDIIFRGPRFDDSGKVVRPASVTVLHNGVLVQDHFVLEGGTAWDEPPIYRRHGEKAPIQLQYHGNPVQFRNIWLREI
jgi:hypothetical protein